MDGLIDPLEVFNAPRHRKQRTAMPLRYAHKHCGRFDHLLGSRLALTHEQQCHGDPTHAPLFALCVMQCRLKNLVFLSLECHLGNGFGPGSELIDSLARERWLLVGEGRVNSPRPLSAEVDRRAVSHFT